MADPGVTAPKRPTSAWRTARRPKQCKLSIYGQLRQAVAAKLKQNWSPEQIAGWLKLTQPGNEAAQVSHETIYRSLYIQARGVLKKELIQHLCARRPIRRSRHATQKLGHTSTPFRSGSDLHRLKIGRCQVIGKVTCSAEQTTARSSLWSNGIHAT